MKKTIKSYTILSTRYTKGEDEKITGMNNDNIIVTRKPSLTSAVNHVKKWMNERGFDGQIVIRDIVESSDTYYMPTSEFVSKATIISNKEF